jgi:hypothetical protein
MPDKPANRIGELLPGTILGPAMRDSNGIPTIFDMTGEHLRNW